MSDPDASPPSDGPPPRADEALYTALVKADRSGSFGPAALQIAHELSEVFTTILGALSLAKDGGDRSRLAAAEQAALEARDLIGRLFALGRDGPARLSVHTAREILDEAAKAGEGSPVAIEIRVAEGTDAVQVNGGQISQAFRNLVRNAIEAMPPPPHLPRIQLGAANTSLEDGRISGLPAGNYVEFEVRDNAGGIPPENLEKIWEPFFTTKRHGAGLGLPAALAIVRRHGGQIGVDSVPGGGSVFTLFLQRKSTEEDIMARPASSRRFATGRVLVMDDDERIRSIAGAVLGSLGYSCDLARDGEEALMLYRRYFEIGRPHDAVILDLTVSKGAGGEAIFPSLQALDPDVRAIIASDDEKAARRCVEQGFCGWLSKPFRPADLGRVLKTVIG